MVHFTVIFYILVYKTSLLFFFFPYPRRRLASLKGFKGPRLGKRDRGTSETAYKYVQCARCDLKVVTLQDPGKRDTDSECGVPHREGERIMRSERSVTQGRRRGPDKQLSLIPFVSVRGFDSVTFEGSDSAPSFLLIMQEPIRSRLTPVSSGGH